MELHHEASCLGPGHNRRPPKGTSLRIRFYERVSDPAPSNSDYKG